MAFAACNQWRHIGLFLDVDPKKLDEIERDRDKDVEEKFMDLLKVWLESTKPQPTVEALAEALEHEAIADRFLAQKIRKHLLPSLSPIPSPKRPRLEHSLINGNFNETGKLYACS